MKWFIAGVICALFAANTHIDIGNIAALKSWKRPESLIWKRQKPEDIAGGTFEKHRAVLEIKVRRYANSEEARAENARQARTNAAQSPVDSKRIESQQLGLYEFSVGTAGRMAPSLLLVRGTRGNIFYRLYLHRNYRPGEKTPTKKLLLAELEQIVVELVAYIER